MKNSNIYAGYRYPAQIISQTVWLYHRFTLSFRDIEELLAARGIVVSYGTIRQWCKKYGLSYCKQLKRTEDCLVIHGIWMRCLLRLMVFYIICGEQLTKMVMKSIF